MKYSHRIDWDNEARLGVWPDAELARTLGVTPASVYRARTTRKIEAPKKYRRTQGGALDRMARSLRTEIQHLRQALLTHGAEIKDMRRLFSRCGECGAEPGHLCMTDNDAPTETHDGRGA